jgi:hypothetical protein
VFFLLLFLVVADNFFSAQNISFPDNFDHRDSLNVRFVGRCNTPGYAYDVDVSGSYAYVADYYQGLRIIDISNPQAPVEVGHCDSARNAVHVLVRDSLAYVASHSYGLRVVDVRDPANPVFVGVFPALPSQGIYNVDLRHSVAYAISSIPCPSPQALRSIDVTDPANMVQRDSILAGEGTGQHLGLRVQGDNIFLNSSSAPEFLVFNIADPDSLVQIGGCALPAHPGFEIQARDSFAYTTCAMSGLVIVKISNPAQPRVVGQVAVPSYAYGVDLSGAHAMVTAGSAGLRVEDVSDPYHPYEVGFHDTPGYAHSVCCVGSYIYVAADSAGLLIYELLPTGQEETSSPDRKPTFVAGPNPVQHATWISVGIRAEDLGIRIYNAAGRIVNYFALRQTPCAVRWNGTDQNGRPVPDGIYFVVARQGRQNIWGTKIVFSR